MPSKLVSAMTSLTPEHGLELIDGNLGFDVLSATRASQTIDLSQTNLVGIQLIDAGAGSDIVIGSSGADTIVGGAGNDSLFGKTGDDRLSLACLRGLIFLTAVRV